MTLSKAVVRECFIGSMKLMVGCLGLIGLILGALWLAKPLFAVGGRWALVAELLALIFVVIFLSGLYVKLMEPHGR